MVILWSDLLINNHFVTYFLAFFGQEDVSFIFAGGTHVCIGRHYIFEIPGLVIKNYDTFPTKQALSLV